MTTYRLHEEPLQDSWLDAYGHLNEAYYLVPFSNATWKLQDRFGIGTDYFGQTGCALYTLESHLRYVAELRAPALLSIESMILGVDAKRLHVGHVMWCDDRQRATVECMLLHYDTGRQGSVAFPDPVVQDLREAVLDPTPDWVGRSLVRLR